VSISRVVSSVTPALLLALLAVAPVSVRGEGTVYSASEAELDAALADGGTVTLAFDGTITFTNTKSISADTVLDATGQQVTFSGGILRPLFKVEAGVSLTFLNLTLADGLTSSNGGAIYNAGIVIASDCLFTNNQAVGGNGAAGANGTDNPNANGTDAHSGQPGGSVAGGAIYNLGSLALTGCTFQNNAARGGNGGNGGQGGIGGWAGGDGGDGDTGGFARGGAVFSTNSAAITNCTFANNSATGGNGGSGGSGGAGGAIGAGLAGNGQRGGEGAGAGLYSHRLSWIVGTTFSANACTGGNTGNDGTVHGGYQGRDGGSGGNALGGGVCNLGTNATLNSTFHTNTAAGGNGGNGSNGAVGGDGGDGGDGWGGGFYSAQVAGLTNCTLASCGAFGGTPGNPGTGSTAPGANGNPGSTRGGNIARAGGTLALKNSIFAYRSSGGNGYGTVVDAGNNISSDNSINLGGAGSLINTDPRLGPLANNGGSTSTLALLTNSPAIDTSDDAASPAVDQRGVIRPIGAHGDIGAFEFGLVVRGRITLGTNGVEGVLVSAGNRSATTDANGDYALTVAAGTYVLTPSAEDFDFTPATQAITVTEDTSGVDFSAIQLFAISGHVLDGPTGLAGVTLALGAEAVATTDTAGAYRISGILAGTYDVTPSRPGYQFDPPTISVTVGPDAEAVDFQTAYTISGRVVDGTNGLGGVTVSADSHSALSDAAGNYTIPGVPGGTYFVFTASSDYTFSPPREITLGPSATNVNFAVESRLYTFSGRVTEGGVGLAGVRIFGTRTTDSSGTFSFTVAGGTYVLSPSKSGYGFSPKSITVTLPPTAADLNFIAGPQLSSIVPLADGTVRIFVVAPAGQVNRVEASTNLVDWGGIFTNSGGFQFVDQEATNFPARFYRTARP